MQVGRRHGQGHKALVGAAAAGIHHRHHIGHGVTQVGNRRRPATQPRAAPVPHQLVGQRQQPGGVRLVRGIAHGDQGRLAQPEPLLQHIAGGGRLSAAHKAPADPGGRKPGKEGRLHQQGLAADETGPVGGIPGRVAAEIEPAEHLHQGRKRRQWRLVWPAEAAAAQQFQAGLPVVVPEALGLEAVDRGRVGPPAAVVTHRFGQGPAIAATHIADHPVNVEQQHRCSRIGQRCGGWSEGHELPGGSMSQACQRRGLVRVRGRCGW